MTEPQGDPIDDVLLRQTRRKGVGFAIFIVTILIAALLLLFSIG